MGPAPGFSEAPAGAAHLLNWVCVGLGLVPLAWFIPAAWLWCWWGCVWVWECAGWRGGDDGGRGMTGQPPASLGGVIFLSDSEQGWPLGARGSQYLEA